MSGTGQATRDGHLAEAAPSTRSESGSSQSKKRPSMTATAADATVLPSETSKGDLAAPKQGYKSTNVHRQITAKEYRRTPRPIRGRTLYEADQSWLAIDDEEEVSSEGSSNAQTPTPDGLRAILDWLSRTDPSYTGDEPKSDSEK